MIAKELDPLETTLPKHEYEQAGQAALERTAQYLKEVFGKTPSRPDQELVVLNGVRLELGKQAVYLDHLALHAHGLVLVENRSRKAKLEVNSLGEWTQTYRGAVLRIPSPTQQAERKLKFLQGYLEKFEEQLPRLGALVFEHAITVPDEGVFKTPPGVAFPQVCRARELPGHLQKLVKEHQPSRSLFRRRSSDFGLTREELLQLSVFLRQHHKPLERDATAPARHKLDPALRQTRVRRRTLVTVPSAQDKRFILCKRCGAHDLRVVHFQGEYQFRCADCEAHTPVQRDCVSCSARRYVRRSGNEFYIECEHCLSSKLLYTNPPN